jgi:hypothetical protein
MPEAASHSTAGQRPGVAGLDGPRPSLLDAVQVVQPETILRWHRAGVRNFWRWKSRNRAGRREVRALIRRMSMENALWGASRIHGELLKLGYEVAQSTVSKYMARGGKPPSQSWKTFLRNHAEAIAAIDMCVVPTLSFERLFAFLVLGHGRRRLLWFEVTRHPTAAWLAGQITEAIRDRPISPGSPWQKRFHHHSTRPQSPGLDQRHNKSNSRMDRAPDDGGIPLE